jgi:hypothetical protein
MRAVWPMGYAMPYVTDRFDRFYGVEKKGLNVVWEGLIGVCGVGKEGLIPAIEA